MKKNKQSDAYRPKYQALFSKDSVYQLFDDKKFADDLIELCIQYDLRADFETGMGFSQLFRTFHSTPDEDGNYLDEPFVYDSNPATRKKKKKTLKEMAECAKDGHFLQAMFVFVEGDPHPHILYYDAMGNPFFIGGFGKTWDKNPFSKLGDEPKKQEEKKDYSYIAQYFAAIQAQLDREAEALAAASSELRKNYVFVDPFYKDKANLKLNRAKRLSESLAKKPLEDTAAKHLEEGIHNETLFGVHPDIYKQKREEAKKTAPKTDVMMAVYSELLDDAFSPAERSMKKFSKDNSFTLNRCDYIFINGESLTKRFEKAELFHSKLYVALCLAEATLLDYHVEIYPPDFELLPAKSPLSPTITDLKKDNLNNLDYLSDIREELTMLREKSDLREALLWQMKPERSSLNFDGSSKAFVPKEQTEKDLLYQKLEEEAMLAALEDSHLTMFLPSDTGSDSSVPRLLGPGSEAPVLSLDEEELERKEEPLMRRSTLERESRVLK